MSERDPDAAESGDDSDAAESGDDADAAESGGDPDDVGAEGDDADAVETDPYTLQAVAGSTERDAGDDAGDGAADGDDDGGEYYAFWADAVADRILDRNPDEPIVLKGGISPSGIPHLGNANEIVLNYFVAEVLRERGYEVRQVFTTDDRDPLRGLPRTLADLDGEVVALGDVDASALGRNLGKPYTAIPDPFGCCASYGAHFSTLIEGIAEQLDVPLEAPDGEPGVVSNTELYETGALAERTRSLLADRETARSVLAAYQDKVDEDYVPFNPICESCGKITETVTDVHLGDEQQPDAATVDYRCTDLEAGDDVIEGCGHEGTATLREGKLPWRFEWVAQWEHLGVDFEPFGKDHAEGSWPSGVDIARNVVGVEPPVPMVYEWFTLEGEPFSSSAGHVVLVSEVLELVEPEVLRYFFAKDPSRARDFSIERLDQLVDEFDRLEATYSGAVGGDASESAASAGSEDAGASADAGATDDDGASAGDGASTGPSALDGDDLGPSALDGADAGPTASDDIDADEADNGGDTGADESDATPANAADAAAKQRAFAERVYPFLVDEVREERVRIPYTFAAVLGMTEDPALREEIARREGHVPEDAPEWAVEEALERVDRAREWARRTDNEYNYELKREAMPDVDLDPATEAALDDLADFVAAHDDPEAIQGEVYEAAKRHDVDVGDFFATGYRLFFDQEEGPKLGQFLAKLDEAFVVRRLRREG